MRGLLTVGKQLLVGYQEQQRRIEALEKEVIALGGNIAPKEEERRPYGDKDKAKKQQSLRQIVGDIYIDTSE